MKVKATKRMANEIQKQTGYLASLVKYTYDEFVRFVSIYPEREMRDYDIETGKFSAIRIDYPAEEYACPRYLTTSELANIYYGCDGSVNDFFRAVKDAIEI